jgi:RNA polymerase sigma factor (sigma-70 family)
MTHETKERLYLDLLPQMRIEASKAARRFGGNRDDLIQEACLAAWIAIDEFDESRGVKLWTFIERCIYFRLLTVWNTSKRHARTPAIGLVFDEADNHRNESEEALAFADLIEGKIRPRDAEVLRLLCVEGYTLEEIGKQQGCSRQAINLCAKRGVERLKEWRRELRK